MYVYVYCDVGCLVNDFNFLNSEGREVKQAVYRMKLVQTNFGHKFHIPKHENISISTRVQKHFICEF
jgi:hypothetical protein